MPLCIEHSRGGRIIKHSWWAALLNDFMDAAEAEGGLDELLGGSGSWTYREDHSYHRPEDAEEEPILAGDKVTMWRSRR